MSRYHLDQRPDLADGPRRLEIVVGWDGPLQTFFAQVTDLDAKEGSAGRTLVWLGTHWKGEPSVRRVLDALRPWALAPYNYLRPLLADRDADRRTEKPVMLRLLEGAGRR